MTRSSKPEGKKSQPYVPRSDEEKLEAFELLGQLLEKMQEDTARLEAIDEVLRLEEERERRKK